MQNSHRVPLCLFGALIGAAGCAGAPDAAPGDSTVVYSEESAPKAAGVSHFLVSGDAASYQVVGYSKGGSAVTSLAITAQAADRYTAVFSGYGTSVTLDVTVTLDGKGGAQLAGTMGGHPFTATGNRYALKSVKRSGSVAFSAKQLALLDLWHGVDLPTMLEKASLGDCAIAIGRALLDIAACAHGSLWSCWGAIGSISDAIGTCKEAID